MAIVLDDQWSSTGSQTQRWPQWQERGPLTVNDERVHAQSLTMGDILGLGTRSFDAEKSRGGLGPGLVT